MNKADLILHPARLQILLTLTGGSKTTQEVSDLLPDIPKSSIYRHIKVLLEGGMVAVDETRLVKGIEERSYRLEQAPHLGPEDVAGFTREDHVRYFASYLAAVLKGFSDYVNRVPQVDMLADRVGYSETTVHASTEELDELGRTINAAIQDLANKKTVSNRKRHKFVFISYPVIEQGEKNGNPR